MLVAIEKQSHPRRCVLLAPRLSTTRSPSGVVRVAMFFLLYEGCLIAVGTACHVYCCVMSRGAAKRKLGKSSSSSSRSRWSSSSILMLLFYKHILLHQTYSSDARELLNCCTAVCVNKSVMSLRIYIPSKSYDELVPMGMTITGDRS